MSSKLESHIVYGAVKIVPDGGGPAVQVVSDWHTTEGPQVFNVEGVGVEVHVRTHDGYSVTGTVKPAQDPATPSEFNVPKTKAQTFTVGEKKFSLVHEQRRK